MSIADALPGTHACDCMQVLSSIVRRAIQADPQMRVAMDEQILTYINDAGLPSPESLKPVEAVRIFVKLCSASEDSLGVMLTHGMTCRCLRTHQEDIHTCLLHTSYQQ